MFLEEAWYPQLPSMSLNVRARLGLITMSARPQADEFTALSMKEIIARLKGVLTLSREERQKKDLLLERVVNDAPQEQVEFLRQAAQQKRHGTQSSTLYRKQKREEVVQPRRTVQRLDEGEEGLGDDEDDGHEPLKYLALPTEQERKACYR